MTAADLDDILTTQEAADLLGRTPDAIRKAISRGRLDARAIGPANRQTWITTRAAVAVYRASVAEGRRPPPRRLS